MRSVTELLRNRADTCSDRLAYTFLKNGASEVASLNYAELDQRSRVVAAALQAQARAGDRVLLMYPPGLEFIAGFLGCLYAGIVAVPAYAPNPARAERYMPRLSAIAHSANTGIILTTSDQAGRFPSLMQGIGVFESAIILETDRLDVSLADDWKPVAANKDTLALLQYTSGSTAEPKGVMVSHGNILHNLEFIHASEANDKDSISVTWLPSFHDMGLLEGILSPVYGTYPLYLMSPQAFIQRPVNWLRAISSYHATNSGGPNFAYEYCMQAITPEQREGLDLSSWRVAYNGSEPIHLDTMQRFNRTFRPYGFKYEAFCPVYGLAESTALTAATPRGAGPGSRLLGESGKQAVACGRPGKGSRILVVNPDNCRPCDSGEQGEIWLAGPSVALGYWNDPERSERTFNAYIADTGEGPFLRTGDLGYLVDGEVFITGRIKDLIIIRGRKLYPQDIEYSASRAHGMIRENGVAAFSVDAGSTEHLVLLAELDPRSRKKRTTANESATGSPPTDYQDIVLDLVESISREHEARVSTVLLVAPGQIARTSSGKIRRFLCRERFLADSIDLVYRWDTTSRLQAAGNNSR